MLSIRRPYQPAFVRSSSSRVQVGATAPIDTTPAPGSQFSVTTFLVGAAVGGAATAFLFLR